VNEYGPNLRILDKLAAVEQLDLATELFHRINRVIPDNQELLTIPPTHLVRDAIQLMLEHGYSQIPVVHDGDVLGVFSYRSLAKEAANMTLRELTSQRCAPGDLPVDEFLEPFEFARVTQEMNHVFDVLDRDNAVLIGTPDRLIGILTPMDFLRYLYRVASPFVLVSEIELAVRALMRLALDEEQIRVAARRSLGAAYGSEDKVPMTLEDMTFDNYQSMLSNGENWRTLESVFGSTRTRVSAKLKEVGAIRNALFHFRREFTVKEHQSLADHRNWLLNKVKQAQTHRGKEAKP
jgi:predicted transcriptional regulator